MLRRAPAPAPPPAITNRTGQRLRSPSTIPPAPVPTRTTASPAAIARVRIFQYLDGKEIRVESPHDRLLMSVQAFVAESERDKAKLRTRDALVARHRRGHVTGGTVYGYRNVPEYGGTDSSGNPI